MEVHEVRSLDGGQENMTDIQNYLDNFQKDLQNPNDPGTVHRQSRVNWACLADCVCCNQLFAREVGRMLDDQNVTASWQHFIEVFESSLNAIFLEWDNPTYPDKL